MSFTVSLKLTNGNGNLNTASYPHRQNTNCIVSSLARTNLPVITCVCLSAQLSLRLSLLL